MKPGLAADILAAVSTLHRGDREQAHEELEAIWARVDPDDHFHRCVVAHYLAEAQSDPAEELRFDILALAAARRAEPAEFDGRFPGLTLVGFLPTLHVKLATAYERVGELTLARLHATEAKDALAKVPVGPAGDVTRAVLARLNRRLG
ncbi:MAG: hypothetical protein JO257_04450 [Deltaproteobacteria bacterium]|nr:hypothetical protein [Deltaproteobacteria bacterium]